ncbi:MAG TPA: hypothetical protein VG826_31825 [Pirellulales bacterium]|nr:hypothetical protein [Pirellulales bacterium]
MHSIKATWTKGQIVPSEPIDWPEGSQLVVEPIAPNGAQMGLTEDQWRDDPDSIKAWVVAVEQIEPLIWKPGEREELDRHIRLQGDFNIDAVRKQMEEMSRGDAP